MKRGIAITVTVILLLSFTACSQGFESRAIKKPGVAPVSLTKQEKTALDFVETEGCFIFSYKQPEGSTGVEIRTYYLDKDKKWKNNGTPGQYAGPEDDSYGNLNGIVIIKLRNDNMIETVFKSKQVSVNSFTKPIALKEEGVVKIIKNSLTEYQEMTRNEEIPIVIIGRTQDETKENLPLRYFFTPEKIYGNTLVQVVTIRFTDSFGKENNRD